MLADPESARRCIAARALRPQPVGPPEKLPDDVEVTVVQDTGWPVYTVKPSKGRAEHRAVYIHGGAWVNQIAPVHWRFITHLAAASNTEVRVPVYPLVPWSTAEQVVAWVASLVRKDIAGAGAQHTFLIGDSSGGQIALSAAIWLRDNADTQPDRVILIAPALDLSLTNPAIPEVEQTDPWLSRAGIHEIVHQWRGALPVDDPRVSPLTAPLTGLTAISLFSGTRDIFNPDARLFADKARQAGVDIDYVECEGMVHVYPMLRIPEGRAARRLIVDTVRAASRQGR